MFPAEHFHSLLVINRDQSHKFIVHPVHNTNNNFSQTSRQATFIDIRLHQKNLHLIVTELLAVWAKVKTIQVIKLRAMRWAGNVAHIGKKINAYGTLVGKPDEKKPVERQGHRLEDNTRTNLTKTRHQSIDWIHILRIKSSGGLLRT
jgi:hypothetical protein